MRVIAALFIGWVAGAATLIAILMCGDKGVDW